MLQEEVGEFEQAEEHLRKASLGIDSDNRGAFLANYWCAACCYQQEKFDLAAIYFKRAEAEKAHADKEELFKLFNNLAATFERIEKQKESDMYMKLANKHKPKKVDGEYLTT